MKNTNDYINLICMSIFAAVFLALAATAPCTVKAKSHDIHQDADAVDHEARAYCKTNACKPTGSVDNPFEDTKQ